ncbi:hypothetical protein [Paenibacillus sp. y28]|uniref:hypothetical protein n=1 Tax=Paenibacillus sp. y28 TaxID=3129110 RepID=UPI00301893B6
MMKTTSTYKINWFNDYLDLYNYAGSLNDREWQEQIMETLRAHQTHLQQESQQVQQWELWKKFEELNEKLLSLFARLKESESLSDTEEIKRQMWELKIQRLELGRKMHAAEYKEVRG